MKYFTPGIPLWIRLTTSWHVIKCHYFFYFLILCYFIHLCHVITNMTWGVFKVICFQNDMSQQVMIRLHLIQRGSFNFFVVQFAASNSFSDVQWYSQAHRFFVFSFLTEQRFWSLTSTIQYILLNYLLPQLQMKRVSSDVTNSLDRHGRIGR